MPLTVCPLLFIVQRGVLTRRLVVRGHDLSSKVVLLTWLFRCCLLMVVRLIWWSAPSIWYTTTVATPVLSFHCSDVWRDPCVIVRRHRGRTLRRPVPLSRTSPSSTVVSWCHPRQYMCDDIMSLLAWAATPTLSIGYRCASAAFV